MRTISFLMQAAICLLLFFHYQTCATKECAFEHKTSVAALEANSSQLDQQCVTVTGKVTDKISTAVLKLYYLRDTTNRHELMVTVPLTDPLPSIGDEVLAGGQLIELFNISEVLKSKVLAETKRATIKRNAETNRVPKEIQEGETTILPY